MPPLPAFFLLLLLLAGFVPPAAAQSPPTVSLQPGGMLTMMEHAVPTELYFDGDEYDGLDGARGIAVSGDLLFVAGQFDDALSVWRVNAEAATLSQTVLYRDNVGGIDGLFRVRNIAVSGDGALLFVTGYGEHALSVWRVNAEAGTLSQTVVYRRGGANGGLFGVSGMAVSDDLLFVTADSDNALSVWRVNAEAATLSQTVVYRDGVGGIDGLRGANGIAVSGDGDLLFVAGEFEQALSVWRVNAEAGTLSQTALYQDSEVDETNFDYIGEVDGRVDGLTGARSIAVSGDDKLLFVAAIDQALSVWRVNAEAGTLSQTALYRQGENGIDGLLNANDVAVSGDGALLFVTAAFSALSVWRVNAEAGTLSQTVVYRDDLGGIDGLFGANGIAVSSDLLFVTGMFDNALSTWQINNAEVPLEVQTVIRVQSDLPVAEEVMVTVTAQSGADSMDARPVTLSPGTRSADAIFPPGVLSPGGRWIFTAQANPPTALDTGAARIAMQVLPPLLSLEPQQKRFAPGDTIALTVRTIAGLSTAASFDINAIKETTATITVEYSAGDTEQEVFFPAEDIAMFGLGQLDFFFRLPDDSPFRVGDGPAATVQIVNPQLRLVPLQELFALGSTVILTVRANVAEPVNTTYSITALRTTSAQTSFTITVEHPAGATEQEVSFPARLFSSTEQWEFSIRLPDGSPFRIGDGSTATVQIVIPQLRLVPLQQQFALGSTVLLTVRADPGAPTEATYDIIARRLASPTTFPIEVTHPAGVTAQEVPFPALQITSPGQWEFSIRLPEDSPFQVIANGTATVYVAPVLSLLPQRESFPAGVAVNIEVQAESPPAVAAAVTITARRQQDGVEVNAAEAVTLSPDPEVLSGQAMFPADTLGDGVWVFTAQSEPPEALYTANARAEAAVLPPPLLLEVSAPPSVTVGNTFTVTVEVAAGRPLPEGVSVAATVSFGAADSEAIAEREVTLTGEPRTATEEFTAPVRSGIFRVEISGPAEVSGRAVIGASASVTVVPVAVMLQLSAPDAVPVRLGYQVTVNTNMPVPAGTTLEVTVSAGTEPQEVSLTAANPSEEVPFTAPLNVGEVIVTARAEVRTAPDAREVVVTAAVTQTVQVLAEGTVALTLDAPLDVTVGDTFTVTVGVNTETPLPESLSVMTTVSFRTVDDKEIDMAEVVLTSMMSSATEIFTAPFTAGIFRVEVSGPAEVSGRAVLGASALVTVVPVAVMLQLSGPQEAVTVGQDYQVTVDTVMPVPEGTTLEVTVTASAGTDLQEQVVLLTADNSEDVPFTAPLTAGAVMVTAMAEVQTAADAREVAVAEAVTRTVAVSALDVQLVLSEFPDLVAAGSTFTVTVGTEPALPEGAAVQVTVSLAAFSSEPVTLRASNPTANVLVMAPAAGGAAMLAAAGGATADSTLELNVLAAEAVTVREQVSLSLRLEAPPEVTARDSFEVTVSAEPEVPAGATVTVTVVFDGMDSSPVALSAEMPSTTVILTARRIGNNLALMTSSAVTVAEPNVLQVMVADADASVNAVAQSVELTLMVSPQRVNIDEEIEVTVGVAPALLADTTLTVEVMADTASEAVILTDATPSRQVRFTAVAAGPLEVSARVSAVAPVDLVTVENTPMQTVQVREEGTVELTLDAPKNVTVGNTFTVTVGVAAETLLPTGSSVSATVSFSAVGSEDMEVVLIPGAPSTAVILTAPRRSGIFLVEVSGRAEAASISEVVDTSARVSVESVRVTLTLRGPDAVTVGETYQVMVGTNMAVPEGTALEVTVSDGTERQEVSLTAANPSEDVPFTAPLNVGEVMVTATVEVQTAPDALEVAEPDDVEPLAVSVSARRDVQLVLLAFPRLVAAGSPFPVTVGATPEVPEGTTVMVTVSLGNSSAPVTLTPRAATERVLVTAPTEGGTAILRAEVTDGALELNVLPAETTVQVQVQVLQLGLQRGQPLTAGSPVTLTVRAEIELHRAINYTVMALHTVSETISSMLTMHPAGTTTQEVSFSGQQIASPGQWEFSILPAELLFESMPITVTISLDFIQPQGIINADDLLFALRYLVRCEGSAAGCQANGEDLASLARNLGNDLQIEQLPAALQLLDVSGGGEERPAANWFILLLGLQGLPVELLFPASEEPSQLENDIRSMLSVQEQEE